jgi:outer membrane protein assembly factor BamB
VIPTPVVGEGLVFAASGRAGPTLAIRRAAAATSPKTHVAWTTSEGRRSSLAPRARRHPVSRQRHDEHRDGLRGEVGQLLWQGRLGDAARESFSPSPVVVDGKLFFTNDMGETFVVAAGREFRLLHVNRLNARTLVAPRARRRPVVLPHGRRARRNRPAVT